jgi:hypothetical protein
MGFAIGVIRRVLVREFAIVAVHCVVCLGKREGRRYRERGVCGVALPFGLLFRQCHFSFHVRTRFQYENY